MEQKNAKSLKMMAAEAILKIDGYRSTLIAGEDIPWELKKYIHGIDYKILLESLKGTDRLIERLNRSLDNVRHILYP